MPRGWANRDLSPARLPAHHDAKRSGRWYPPGTDESYYSLRGIEQVLPEGAVPLEALADKMFARAGHKLEDDAAQGVTDS
jgi:hypothetical protein